MYYDLTIEQHDQLLKGLHGSRVAKRTQGGKSLSYLEAWDVKAHLNRIFGFTGWSWDVNESDLVFEEQVTGSKGGLQWSVGWKVVGTLRVAGASYSEAAIGSSSQGSRGDAHDMAIKTAESDALKRCAINLGDQFGLSLYNNGSLVPVVKGTLYTPLTEHERRKGIENVLNGVELPAKELEVAPVESPESPQEPSDPPEAPTAEGEAAVPVVDDAAAEEWASRLRVSMNDGDVANIVAISTEMRAAGVLDLVYNGKTLAKLADLAVVHAGKVVAGKAELGGEEIA